MNRLPADPLDLLLVANSPGELAGWAAPIVREVRRRVPETRIFLVLPPCQYAGGGERAWASSLPGVDGALRIGPLLLRGESALPPALPAAPASRDREGTRATVNPGEVVRAPSTGNPPSPRRIVLHAGGDPAYSLLLARRLGCPADACLSRPRYLRSFRRFYVPDETAAERFRIAGGEPGRVVVVGHLPPSSLPRTDAREISRASRNRTARTGEAAPGTAPVLAIFPGSRPFEYLPALPFFARTIEELVASGRPIRPWIALAPQVEEERILRTLQAEGIRFVVNGRGRVAELLLPLPLSCRTGRCNGPSSDDITEEEILRVPLVRERIWEEAAESNMAVCFPGTNNLQLAALGTPLLCVVPTNRAEEIPMDGLIGLILALPGLRLLKRRLVPRLLAKVPFVSLPNRIAGIPIVPELRGHVTPAGVARAASTLLDDPEKLALIRSALRRFADRGAAERVAERLLEP